jgi:RNA polymerase sigma factor (TIGR02999 family)
MTMDEAQALTQLLNAAQGGDEEALENAFAAVYPMLRRISRARRRGSLGTPTLDTTALVHEAYLKLAKAADFRFKNRGHFFATASKAMRQALVTYAERRRAAKRGGDAVQVTMGEVPEEPAETWEELISLDRALARLEQLEPRQARVVECLFFAGLDVADTAEALDISTATVKRDWAAARVWLYGELQRRGQPW